MSAIITQTFRKNNIQNLFENADATTSPVTAIVDTSGSAAYSANVTLTPTVANIRIKPGMAVTGSNVPTGALVYSVGGISGGGIPLVITLTVPVGASAIPNASVLTFTDQYFIAIGKSDQWTGTDGTETAPAAPIAAHRTNVEARGNLIALKKVVASLSGPNMTGSAGYMLPRNNWVTGQKYKFWDSSDPSCFYASTVGSITYYPCYIISGTKVFICLNNSASINSGVPGTNTNAPTGATLFHAETTDSGVNQYTWAYVADINQDAGILDSNQFVKIAKGPSTMAETGPVYTAGKIYACKIVSGGTGYTNGTYSAAAIRGDGSGATITTTVSSGVITSAFILANGSGYTQAEVDCALFGASGVGGVIVPVVIPPYGLGYDPVADLPTWFAGFYATWAGADSPYPVANGNEIPWVSTTPSLSFRQVSLIRNPVVVETNSSPSVAFRALKSIKIASALSGVNTGDVIEVGASNARAFVDYYDTTNSIIYYHQNNSTFVNGTTSYQMNTIPLGSSGIITKTYTSGGVTSGLTCTYLIVGSTYNQYSATISSGASGSPTLTLSTLWSTSSFPITPGMYVSGTNIPAGTQVLAVSGGSGSTTTVTLSQNLAGTASGTVYFSLGGSKYIPNTGEIIYLHNRIPVTIASSGQSEVFNVIVQF